MTHEEFSTNLPELKRTYQISSDVAQKLGNITMLMIIGPSGVGKTTIIKQLPIQYVVAETTRGIRPGEEDGQDYHFNDDFDEIMQRITAKRFVQIAVGPGGDFYGTSVDAYPDSGTVVYSVVAEEVPHFRELGFKNTISAFIAPPSHKEWLRRLQNHPITPEQLAKRMVEAKRSLNFALQDDQMHFILNDDLDKAVIQTLNLLEGQTDLDQEDRARQAAQNMLDGIN